MNDIDSCRSAARFGFWAAVATPILTIVTFGLAITAFPNSGRGCQTDCATYPFAGDLVASQFPGDYLWMLPAMALTLLFVALIAAVHQFAAASRRVFSLVGLCFAVVAAAALLTIQRTRVETVGPLPSSRRSHDSCVAERAGRHRDRAWTDRHWAPPMSGSGSLPLAARHVNNAQASSRTTVYMPSSSSLRAVWSLGARSEAGGNVR